MKRDLQKALTLFLILKDLDAGKVLTSRDVAKEHNISLRTAQRYLCDLSSVAPVVNEGSGIAGDPWTWRLMR